MENLHIPDIFLPSKLDQVLVYPLSVEDDNAELGVFSILSVLSFPT
jgi:hypothetical protein